MPAAHTHACPVAVLYGSGAQGEGGALCQPQRGAAEAGTYCLLPTNRLLGARAAGLLTTYHVPPTTYQAPEPGCTAAALAESALRDADRAVELDASYAKGSFRRAQVRVRVRVRGRVRVRVRVRVAR